MTPGRGWTSIRLPGAGALGSLLADGVGEQFALDACGEVAGQAPLGLDQVDAADAGVAEADADLPGLAEERVSTRVIDVGLEADLEAVDGGGSSCRPAER